MLSTTANPTDGLDSTVLPNGVTGGPVHLGQRGEQAAEWSW